MISDEIYHRLHYEDRAVSALEITDEVYVINSFSKYFSMTGWRVGSMVVPADHLRVVERLAQNIFICPPDASQVAALAALDCGAELEANPAVYAKNRQLMLAGLPRAGFTRIAPPDGAGYIYADSTDLTDDSRAFAAEILAEAGVAVTPGLDFDPLRGGQTLGFSYASSSADSAEGLRRPEAFMAAAMSHWRRFRARLWLALALTLIAAPGLADTPAAIRPEASHLRDAGGGIELVLALSAPVPYKIAYLDRPPRLVVDFEGLDFGLVRPEDVNRSTRVAALRWGVLRPGWSRLVAELDRPYLTDRATLDTAKAVLTLRLRPVGEAEFLARVAPPPDKPPQAALPTPKRRQTGARPLIVVLDPGHGGLDPGAEAGGTTEAALMLGYARELAGVLRTAGIEAVLSREDDRFVPLEARISIARAAGADVLLSLHADALVEGRAYGATIYRLSAAASDAASALLAARHDRADLLAGVDLSAQDDQIADVLMELARVETGPRADRLAEALVAAIQAAGGKLHSQPIQSGAFSVLKAPDIPSLLLELGFLTSPADLARLTDPAWRAAMHGAVRDALLTWAKSDATEAALLRR